MDKVKELEIQGCKTFVCPNLSAINEKSKELNLKDTTIDRAKNLAIKYFQMTYRKPHYSSSKRLLPAFIYIASILEDDKISQTYIANVFKMSHVTIKKWYRDIAKTLDIDIEQEKRNKKIYVLEPERCSSYLHNIGTTLKLKDTTIDRAKTLATKYFNIPDNDRLSEKYVKQLLPAFIYTASIIENDRRSQLEVYEVSGVYESIISKCHNDILRSLGMKIICHDKHVITVLDEQYD